MTSSLKASLISYLAKRRNESQSGFTLVELIVVVVIIGILSSIAIPSFQNASEKAKQKEASTLVASYMKAAQAYFTETSQQAQRAVHLGEYVTVTECRWFNADQCKRSNNSLRNISTSNTTRWNSPSGFYRITFQRRSATMVNFLAVPGSASGLGVVGCYNSGTGATKLRENPGTEKGPGRVRPISC
tara:strand:+ start:1360 stop:1920 length:561 start_codon:yes stop_codon:yes gene_type:complete